MTALVKFDLGLKFPWNRISGCVKSTAWVYIHINDKKTRWELTVQNSEGNITFAVYSAFSKSVLHQIFIKIMIYDIKTKIICSKDVSSDEVTNVLTDVYKVEDVLINERVLSAMGYASPDDLSIDCCFEVVTLSTGIDMAAPGNIDGEVNSGDLDIECSDGSIIRVHQHILANQSMALKRSLKKNKFEIDNAKVLRVSYSSEVVKEMVRFVYTGKINQVTGKEREQMKLANEYQLKGIFGDCEKFVADSLNVDNVIEMMIFAEQNKAESLKTATLDFATTHFKDVKQTEGWKMISCHPKLMMQLLESI